MLQEEKGRAKEVQEQLKAARLHNIAFISDMTDRNKIHTKTAKYLFQRYSRRGQKAKFLEIMKAEKNDGNVDDELMWKKLTEASYFGEEEPALPDDAKGFGYINGVRKINYEVLYGPPNEDEEDDEEDEKEDDEEMMEVDEEDEEDIYDEGSEEPKVEEKKWPKTFELVIR